MALQKELRVETRWIGLMHGSNPRPTVSNQMSNPLGYAMTPYLSILNIIKR